MTKYNFTQLEQTIDKLEALLPLVHQKFIHRQITADECAEHVKLLKHCDHIMQKHELPESLSDKIEDLRYSLAVAKVGEYPALCLVYID
jgi:hypothetical protein